MVSKLAHSLASSSQTLDAESTGQLRRLLHLVTGGKVLLYQCGRPTAQCGWLEGRFSVNFLRALDCAPSTMGLDDNTFGNEYIIEFKRPPRFANLASKAFELDQQGLLRVEIANRLKCRNANVAKLLTHEYRNRGLPIPDGRARRVTLTKKHRQDPTFKRIADEVMSQYRDGVLLGDIAARLNVNPNVIAKAVAFWHTQRGLPVPNGRTRRKSLTIKCKRRAK